MDTTFDLSGKTALVTGCNKGIGQGIAIGLANAGANIIGVSSSMTKDSKTQKEIESLGREFKSYSCDFSNRNDLYSFINQVKKDGISPDILVNNAGIIKRAPAVEHSDDLWDSVIEINLNAQFILSREFGKEMIKKGYGKIIFTASLLSFQGGITVPGYAASKGGIAQLTKALANEWAVHGINVNAIAPGYIATDNTQALRADPIRSNSILERIPAARWGKPEDFAGPAVFLASKASDYVHGIVMCVDGGWMGR